jgi:two-component system sensor histidine kinase HydH
VKPPSLISTGIASFLRAEDIAWLLLFTGLAVFGPDLNYDAYIILLLFAAFLVAEPKIKAFSTRRGQIVALLVKVLLSYLLIGFSHGIDSNYYLILLLPVISAATSLDLAGTTVFILLCATAYLSFLGFINWETHYIPPDQQRLLCLHVAFIAVAGYLVYLQARAKRDEMLRTQEAIDRLTEANRNLRRAEASLRRSERLAALGQLTAGLAHELRNPLGTIKASAELLEKPVTQSNPAVMQELTGYITSEVDRTNSLISRFLDFARPLRLHAKAADLCETVSQTIAQMRPRAEARDIRLETAIPEYPVEFSFDSDLLAIALTNLIHNAIEASSPGSVVLVAVEPRGGGIHLSVSDQGTGIASEHLESIFNPFFTTRTDGTGLGLAIVTKIVDEHNGKITVQSTPGAGTTFDLFLPAGKQD